MRRLELPAGPVIDCVFGGRKISRCATETKMRGACNFGAGVMALAVALPIAACRAAKPAADAPLAVTPDGILRPQSTSDGVASYLGVPYARQPVADLRWRDQTAR